MELLLNKLRALKRCPDHPVFHPEGNVYNHILIVTLRALLVSGKPELVLAGFLHDICKMDSGQYIDLKEGRYWSNRDHAIQAAQLCETDDVRYFIKSFGADWDIVHGLVRRHMEAKQGGKKALAVPHMGLFTTLDDMVQRTPFPQVTRNIWVPEIGRIHSAELFFVGQSPIQYGTDQLTVTLNGTPFTYPIKDAYIFFGGRYQWFHDNL